MILLPVPYINQWNRLDANAKINDCGVASVLMVLRYVGRGGALTVNQLSAETTLRQSDTGLNCGQLVTLAARHGLSCVVNKATTLDQIRAELTAGRPVIPLIALRDILERVDQADNKPGHDLHFFVIIGFGADTFIVNDPDAWPPYLSKAIGMVIQASELDRALGDALYSRECVFIKEGLPMTIDSTKLNAWIAQADALSADMKTELAALTPPVVVPPPVGTPRSATVNAPGGLNAHVGASTSTTTGANIPNGTMLTVTDTGIKTADGYVWEQVVTPSQYAKLFVVAKYLNF